MLGHVLPLAFCPQTCGLNDFLKTVFIAPIAFGEFGRRLQEQISGQRENWGAEDVDVWVQSSSLPECLQLAASRVEHPQGFPE